jgi:hypothetical protein
VKDGGQVPIQGVVKTLLDTNGKSHTVGYYSSHQMSSLDAPDYNKSHFFFIDEMVFGNNEKRPFIRWRKKFFHRECEAGFDGVVIVSFSYPWPWYRELFFNDDFDNASEDVVYNLFTSLKYTHPDWVC